MAAMIPISANMVGPVLAGLGAAAGSHRTALAQGAGLLSWPSLDDARMAAGITGV